LSGALAGERPAMHAAAGARLRAMWLVAALAGAAYVALRLYRLHALPLFIDEGTYAWWGYQILAGDFSRGLGQGKPLMGWMIALGLAGRLDPVTATRLPGILLGLGGLAATAWLAARHVSPRAALLVCVLWLALPYVLFFERVSTPDQVLGALGIAAFALAWRGLHAARPRPAADLLAGAALALAGLAKMPVSFAVLAIPAGIAALSPATRQPPRAVARVLRMSLPPLLLAAGAVLVAAWRWRAGLFPLGFGFDEIALKTGGGSASAAGNLAAVAGWLGAYLTWPLAVLLAGAWLAGLAGRGPLPRLMAVAATFWTAAFLPIADFWVPRYLAPILPCALLLMAWALAGLLDRWAGWAARRLPGWAGRWALSGAYAAACVAIVALAAGPAGSFLADPRGARFPPEDRQQYVEGRGSGYGLPEAVALAQSLMMAHPESRLLTLSVHDAGRVFAYLPRSLHHRAEQVHIIGGRNQSDAQRLEHVLGAARQGQHIYLLTGSTVDWPPAWQAAMPQAAVLARFDKPGGRDAVEVREIAQPEAASASLAAP
jgi:hypothetical protein